MRFRHHSLTTRYPYSIAFQCLDNSQAIKMLFSIGGFKDRHRYYEVNTIFDREILLKIYHHPSKQVRGLTQQIGRLDWFRIVLPWAISHLLDPVITDWFK